MLAGLTTLELSGEKHDPSVGPHLVAALHQPLCRSFANLQA